MKSLYLEGVRVIFGLPGVQLYHAMDALYREQGIRFITTRHEQATGYMADGYSRAGGEGIGTALMVPGPGLLNASGGISTAYAASSAIMVVCGQIERDLIGVNRGMLHEVDDQLESIRPVTKWAQRVLNPADIPEAVHEAFRQLKTGRPRPVEIEVPPETLAELADVELREPEEPRQVQADRERVERAAQMLTQAVNPLIWVGGGAVSSGATQALVKVAEHLQAGVITTAEGKGAISDKHPLALGALWLRNDNIAQAFDHDVILAVGTRMGTPGLLGGQKIIQIDVDEEELGRNYEDTFSILGDASSTLEQLYGALSGQGPARPDRSSEVAAQKAARAEASITAEPQASLLGAVRSAMPDDGILVAGMTQVGYYSRAYFPVYEPRTFLTSSYSGNLGYAYPTALGAKVAQPDKAVVALSGDGGFLFNSQELATAVQHEINAVVVVFNDNAFGNVMRDQINRFEGRIIGSKLHNPDFVKLVEAYGARGIRVSGAEDLESTLRDVLGANDAPTLIEVPVGMMPSPFA